MITDLGALDVADDAFVLVGLAPEVTLGEIIDATGPPVGLA